MHERIKVKNPPDKSSQNVAPGYVDAATLLWSAAMRTDTASANIAAYARAYYQAFTNHAALLAWLPPDGMTAKLYTFIQDSGCQGKRTQTRSAVL